MARIKAEEIVDHLSREFRKALEFAVQDEIPDVDFDPRSLFRAFKKGIRRKCSTWERVPDKYVDKD